MEFGEISNVISSSSTSLRYTKQLKDKGEGFANNGNLPLELAELATYLWFRIIKKLQEIVLNSNDLEHFKFTWHMRHVKVKMTFF